MKVLLVEGHPLIRYALAAMLEDLAPTLQLDTAQDAAAAQAAMTVASSGLPYALVLLDLDLPQQGGWQLLAQWRDAHPLLPVAVLSDEAQTADMLRALDCGASGFIAKRGRLDELVHGLQLVLDGGIYVPALLRQASEDGAGIHAGAPAAPPGTLDAARLGGLGLTPRQTDVLLHLLHGASNKRIAEALGIRLHTVKDHVAAVLRSLGVQTRTQAVLAVGRRLAPPA